MRGGVVEIEHRQLTGVGLTAEWAFGLRGVVEDVPTLFAVAGLQEIARLDESVFPFCCAGAPGRCVESLNKGPIEKPREIGSAQRVGALLRVALWQFVRIEL